jgi:hypothetical protein
MSDAVTLSVIAKLDAKLDRMAKASLDAIHEDLSAIERMVRLYKR